MYSDRVNVRGDRAEVCGRIGGAPERPEDEVQTDFHGKFLS